MAARHLALGAAGEEAAAKLLAAKGYRILARNWRSGGLELDLVCREGRTIVFVEVKTRSPGRTTPAEALSPAKRAKLVRAASLWLSENDSWDAPCRFDLVAVTPAADGRLETVHLPEAMTADGLDFQPFA